MPAHARADLVLVLACGVLAAACGDGTPETGDEPESPTPTARPQGEARREDPQVAWTHDEVLRRLDGAVVRIDGQRVRIDRTTITCGGVGSPSERVGGEPAWTRFRCVQPTFTGRSVAGPDAIVVVKPTGRRSFEITERRLIRY